MSAALKIHPKLSPEEYLDFEREAEFKSEYCDGQLIEMMAGASRFHNRCKENLSAEIGQRLKKSTCQSFSSDLRIKVERTNSYFYPDLVIVCGTPEFLDDRGDVLLNPTALIEVLSPSTSKYDRGKKFLHYQRIPSLREYLLVEQDTPQITKYTRQADGSWSVDVIEGLDETLTIETGSLSIPMVDVYDRVDGL